MGLTPHLSRRRFEMDVKIIGTGNMGRGIATRLLAGGHQVTLLDREADNSEALAREFGGSR
jgi:8-hydroxy-5-deazaflavin:NADPH oxidoreductase